MSKKWRLCQNVLRNMNLFSKMGGFTDIHFRWISSWIVWAELWRENPTKLSRAPMKKFYQFASCFWTLWNISTTATFWGQNLELTRFWRFLSQMRKILENFLKIWEILWIKFWALERFLDPINCKKPRNFRNSAGFSLISVLNLKRFLRMICKMRWIWNWEKFLRRIFGMRKIWILGRIWKNGGKNPKIHPKTGKIPPKFKKIETKRAKSPKIVEFSTFQFQFSPAKNLIICQMILKPHYLVKTGLEKSLDILKTP